MRTVIAFALAAGFAGTAIAQEAPIDREPVVKASWFAPRGDDGLMRKAAPVGDVRAWMRAADYPIESRRAGRTGWASVLVAFDAGDRITDCKAGGTADPAMRLAACDAVRSRGKFRHALAPDGGEVELGVDWILFDRRGPGPQTVIVPMPPPMPPAVQWPARHASLAIRPLAEPDWKAAAPKRRRGRAEVGIVMMLKPDGSVMYCRSLQSSGDAALDAATCAAASKVGYTPATGFSAFPMIVAWNGRKAKALLPVSAQGKPAFPIDPEVTLPHSETTGEIARVSILINASGAAERCRIIVSLGSDAADRSACETHLRMKYRPATDVFGRPIPIEQNFRMTPLP